MSLTFSKGIKRKIYIYIGKKLNFLRPKCAQLRCLRTRQYQVSHESMSVLVSRWCIDTSVTEWSEPSPFSKIHQFETNHHRRGGTRINQESLTDKPDEGNINRFILVGHTNRRAALFSGILSLFSERANTTIPSHRNMRISYFWKNAPVIFEYAFDISQTYG